MNSTVLAFLLLVGFVVLVAAIVVVSATGGGGAYDALVAVARIAARLVRWLG